MKVRMMMTAALLAAAPAHAAPGDVEAGRAKAGLCAACHGANGVSAAPAIPSLAGQRDQFLQWQLVFFRTGRRENPVMGPLSQTLSDEDIRNLGAYYASLPPMAATPAPDSDPALRAKGADLAEQHHCSACHQDNYAGKAAAAAVARQHEPYLRQALADYRSAARPSVGVAAMTEAASGLSDDDIAALAHYLATF